MRIKSCFTRIVALFILIVFPSCTGKAKNSYKSESDIDYSTDFIQYVEDLTEYSEQLTSYAYDLTDYSDDLTSYANNLTYLYFGEYTNGIYSVQLQSQEYIKAFLEINGIHTIDLQKIIAQLCVGTGTILITAFILPALPIIAGVAEAKYASQVCVMAIKISSDAIIGAALDAAITGTIKYYETNGDIEQTFYSAIEQSAEGFMWGAVISSGIETIKEIKIVHQAAKKKAITEVFESKIKSTNKSLSQKSINNIIKKNTDDLIKVLEKVPDNQTELVYRFFAAYPDDSMKLYAKYQDDILSIFEKIGKNNEDKLLQILKSQDGDSFVSLINKIQSQNCDKALNILSKAANENKSLLYNIFNTYGDDAIELCAKYQDDFILTYKRLEDNVEYQSWLIKKLKQNGDSFLEFLKEIPNSELTTSINCLRFIDDSNIYIDTLTVGEKKVLADYKGSSYKTINSSLINNKPDESATILKKILTDYKSPSPITVYRGDVGQFGNYQFISINGNVVLPSPGEIIQNNAFTSTAIDIKHTKTFSNVEKAINRHIYEFSETGKLPIPIFAEIKIPQGANVLYIDEMARTNMYINKEALINAGAEFEVISSEVYKSGTILKDGSKLTDDTVFLLLKLIK